MNGLPQLSRYRAPRPPRAAINAMGMVDYCPWRHLGHLEGVTLTWHADGPRGLTRFSESRVSIRRGLNAAGRRSTLAHELIHIERGPGYGGDGSSRKVIEERCVRVSTALRVIPAHALERLPDLVGSHGATAVAEILAIAPGVLRDAVSEVDARRGES